MITCSTDDHGNQRIYELVKCTSDYWEFVRKLRNDDRVQVGFIERAEITEEQQQKYMREFQDKYFVCLLNGEPAGYVGVIDDDIRICTSPKFQNQGIASFMLSEVLKIFPKAFGKVKLENSASRRLFEKLGFKETFIIYTRSDRGNST